MSAAVQGFMILLGTIAFSVLYRTENQVHIEGFTLDFTNQNLKVTHGNRTVLQGKAGYEYDLSKGTVKCNSTDKGACVQWPHIAELQISYEEYEQFNCYNITWSTVGDFNSRHPYDCFDFKDSHWYGGSELYRDHWPMFGDIPLQAYASRDIGLTYKTFGSVLERYWLSSSGVAIIVNDEVPLMFSFNDTKMCIAADNTDRMYVNMDLSNVMKYTVCTGNNLKDLHLAMVNKFFNKPTGLPDERMITQPIWSSWAKYKTQITQNKTIEFAKEIVAHGFDGCQIEIDDMYTTSYGDYVFDPKKFPDPRMMADAIHKMGFRVSAWVHPFANPNSAAFEEGLEKGYFVMDNSGEIPGLIHWWHDFAAAIDFTNPDAVKWYADRLAKISSYGIDSFKYDAGEAGFLPQYFKLKNKVTGPNHYSRLYAEEMYKHTNSYMEVRVGYKSQHLPVFVRMLDKDSEWDKLRGFDTMIPTALQFGIVGYPFVLPDMIGGNAYGDNGTSSGAMPDKELYIRWMALNVFLPSMQFSICPWQYDEETTEIARKMVKLHETYVAPKILRAGKQSVAYGSPIIRPMWWVDPNDPASHKIGDQFMLGDDVLVAPIIKQGATTRDIYLPVGKWKDMLSTKDIEVKVQGHFLRGYQIKLYEVAYFELMSAF